MALVPPLPVHGSAQCSESCACFSLCITNSQSLWKWGKCFEKTLVLGYRAEAEHITVSVGRDIIYSLPPLYKNQKQGSS